MKRFSAWLDSFNNDKNASPSAGVAAGSSPGGGQLGTSLSAPYGSSLHQSSSDANAVSASNSADSLFSVPSSSSTKSSKRKLSLARLKQLHIQLEKLYPLVTAPPAQLSREKRMQHESNLVETLRQLAEVLIWGDQHDESVWEYFFERRLLRFFLVHYPQRHVQIQALQTLCILMQNTSSEVSLYYLLSQNHINEFVTMHGFDFEDEEVLAHYVTLLKILSLKLTPSTLQFFFYPQDNTFPLYTEAIRFFRHDEAMIRASVRTIALNVFRVCESSESCMNFVLSRDSAPYLRNLVHVLVSSCETVDAIAKTWRFVPLPPQDITVVSNAFGTPDYLALTGRIASQVFDDLYYLGDILSLRLAPLSSAVHAHMVAEFLSVLLQQKLDPAWSFFLLAQCALMGERDGEWLQILVRAVFADNVALMTRPLAVMMWDARNDDRYVASLLAFLGAVTEQHVQLDPTILGRCGLLPQSLQRKRRLVNELLTGSADEALSAPVDVTDRADFGEGFRLRDITTCMYAVNSHVSDYGHIRLRLLVADQRYRPVEESVDREVNRTVDRNALQKRLSAPEIPVVARTAPPPLSRQDSVFAVEPVHPPPSLPMVDVLIALLCDTSRQRRLGTAHLCVRLLALLTCPAESSSVSNNSTLSSLSNTEPSNKPMHISSPLVRSHLLDAFLRCRSRIGSYMHDADPSFHEFLLRSSDAVHAKYRQIEGMRWERLLNDPSLCFTPTSLDIPVAAQYREIVELWRRHPCSPLEELSSELHRFFLMRSLLPRIVVSGRSENEWRDSDVLYPRKSRPFRARQRIVRSEVRAVPCSIRVDVRSGPAGHASVSEFSSASSQQFRSHMLIFLSNGYCYIANVFEADPSQMEVVASFPMLHTQMARLPLPYAFQMQVPFAHISGDLVPVAGVQPPAGKDEICVSVRLGSIEMHDYLMGELTGGIEEARLERRRHVIEMLSDDTPIVHLV